MVTIDEAQAMLDEIACELPEAFYSELNGGVMLLEDTVRRREPGVSVPLYTLGTYHVDRVLGRYIEIYYGSFAAVHGHLPHEDFRSKLRDTLVHEFTHHLENLAGERALERKDERQIENLKGGQLSAARQINAPRLRRRGPEKPDAPPDGQT